MKRRNFLSLLGAAGASIAGALWFWRHDRNFGIKGSARQLSTESAANVQPSRGRFPKRYIETLTALTTCLLPEESSGGFGAWGFIQKEVERAEMSGTKNLLMRGAVVLDRMAVGRGGKVFAALSAPEQKEIIEVMLAGGGSTPRFDPPEFIRTMVGLTIEGTFSDPVHGGNRQEAGWQWIAYGMHPPRPHH
ncbi:MAG: gluconate 2-dehydrogenase subunit 3 family protein [Myxococcota bacterium]